MPHWKSELLQQLLEEQEPQRLFGQAVQLAQALDMEFVGLTLHLHVAARGPQVILYNNYPSAWNARYQAEDFIKIDPSVSKCHHTTLPLVWNDELFHEVPQLREAATAYGMTHGWSQSVHDQQHNESQLSVSRAKGAVSRDELFEKSAQVMWLCNTLHAALSTHHLAKYSPLPQLSERELEVLKWSAAGKTAADVAMILSLSTSTVNFHIRSVISKTNASNKAGAIAIAALRGLL
ncbi:MULTISPECIES: autoinducer binding domain-containing protein [unclassified Pseudomonas]|uniref:autoinducer binding domain-containing protein n=1 Tax=unclassified Pseudomonas TaxID=196821 RepID=UPI000C88DE82|nr:MULTISPECIES: autoinducer binding domain-containing protein [unclassified Pseudomonas]PMZ92461.1 LuxR family transcriptional regulator [Pseudomonas sp. FW305-42]PNA20708.1 LuxR family transcriptional regulator [Pseudomonas sp. MPR-R1B]PNB22089.1 LuxR family transcriptional regulator [Pseudomonas sp. DP16D-E2]PNB41288.1 LuxR family transcriptional regulator [Pseudomonas sp. FW305-17]PNB56870.1 LuxR family transcriptional regulator [Pseudomonas sp. GW531-E2]